MQNYNSKFKIIFHLIIFLIFLFTFNLSLLTFNLSKAVASGLDIGIFPPVIQIDTLPPASIQTPMALENFGDTTLNLQIQLKPFKASEKENGEVSYFAWNDPLPGVNPLIFEKIQILENDHVIKNITLAPNQKKTLSMHIGIGKDEPISDYYFSVVFISKDNVSDQSSQSVTSGGIATNVLLSIGPKGKAKGSIEEFSAPFIVEKGPIPFTVRVKNTGEHVIAPRGNIVIQNMFGQMVGKVDLLPVNILTQSIRAIPDLLQSPEATPSENFKFQISNFKFQKAFWRESFLLGPYTAKLTLSLSDQGPIFRQTINFWAVPTNAVIGLAIASILVIFIIQRVRRRLS